MKMAGVPEGTPAVCVCSELKAKNFMRLTGVVEMAVGAGILKGPTRIGAYVASAWLAAITANLISSGKHFDVAAREANLAAAAFVLARLCERKQAIQLREPDPLARAA